jgi:serine phosphatase RsbU (regulator of sigma subunit)
VQSLIGKYRDDPMPGVAERIVREVEGFADGAPQMDDMTILLIRRLPA